MGKIEIKPTTFSFHSQKQSSDEILLTQYFATHHFLQRKHFQVLCNMEQTTAICHLLCLCQEEKASKYRIL